MRTLVVGAYAAMPGDDPEGVSRIISTLAQNEAIAGLELTLFDEIEIHPAWNPAWRHVITDVGGTMRRLGANPDYGLASPDEAGRQEALAFARAALAQLDKLRDAGAQVQAVELHAAPSRKADRGALERSLAEIASWEWGEVQLLVEHCDALGPGQQGDKEFAALEDEIAVVAGLRESDPRWGISLNWGRSAIEGRGSQLPLDHIRQAREAGLLSALFFSSATGAESQFGAPWTDHHHPPKDVDFAPAGSELGSAEIRDAIEAAGDGVVLGAKFGLRPASLGADERLAQLLACLDVVLNA